MIRVKMLESFFNDGAAELRAGGVYDLPDARAARMVNRGIAEVALDAKGVAAEYAAAEAKRAEEEAEEAKRLAEAAKAQEAADAAAAKGNKK